MTEEIGDESPRWRKWAREPFVQFLILGALLFAGHAVWQRHMDYQANSIIVDPEEMERRAILFAGENNRTPTEEELKALLYDYVQEEALVREAKRLGLEEGDTIVRRRLAQKARFMLEDTVDIAQPDSDTLCAYAAENPDKFAKPPKRSFAHIFISPEGKSDAVLRDEAAKLLVSSTNTEWKTLGDPFMLNREYRLASYPDVAKSFGPQFAQAMFALDPQNRKFQGPIESAFGLHLVRIGETIEQEMPDCDAILGTIETVWRKDQRDAANAAKIREIIDQYEVVVD